MSGPARAISSHGSGQVNAFPSNLSSVISSAPCPIIAIHLFEQSYWVALGNVVHQEHQKQHPLTVSTWTATSTKSIIGSEAVSAIRFKSYWMLRFCPCPMANRTVTTEPAFQQPCSRTYALETAVIELIIIRQMSPICTHFNSTQHLSKHLTKHVRGKHLITGCFDKHLWPNIWPNLTKQIFGIIANSLMAP